MLDAHPAPAAPARSPAAVPVSSITEPAAPQSRSTPTALLAAARTLLPVLEAGRALDARTLRDAITAAFGASDADGAWLWKDSYEAAEAALVLFLQRYGRAMRREAGAGPGGPAAMLRMLETLAALEPSQTRRSEEQLKYQQFSTPLPLAYAALQAAMVRPGDVVLEPSAGTGMLAVMAQLALGNGAAGALHLNEIAAVRAGLLAGLFPGCTVTGHNAESIRDRLPALRPTVVLMNPPFSASPGVERIRHHVDLHHIRSAFSMLPPGGRLVAISSAHCVPGDAAWEDAFSSLDPPAHAVFTAPIDGRAYARRGTTFDTRLTVLDRGGEKPAQVYAGHPVRDAGHLLQALAGTVPARRPIEPVPGADLFGQAPAPRPTRAKRTKTATHRPEPTPHDWGPVAELAYEAVPAGAGSAEAAQPSGPYARWRASGIHIPGAVEHPTPLVQSGAMAAVPHPMPSYRPMLPERVVTEGQLSDAQLESVVLAGQAHERHLAAEYRIGAGWETLVPQTVQRVDADGDDDSDEAAPASEDDNQIVDADEPLSDPVRFRRGWMLGDGTGCGKGRQVAAIVLDQWLRGRKRALWLSQSDKLLEDTRRDWCAVGGRADDVIPLGKVRQGADIPHGQGILFATYATLRSPARQGKPSRLDQIVAWLADGDDEDERHAYQGCIVFDEAHAMANAAGSKGSRGEVRPSQQGRAGLRLQNALPDARILYVSATGATTVPGLAYARRLGLWASGETPFETRTAFVAAMEAGGVAAMEVVARDLKALGLYQARALSYDGVEVDILEHPLTPEQRRIYDSYAGAFKIIHANIQDALKATGITDGDSTLATDVKGERRFIATIARRLDSLGAITRGQRDSQTAMGDDDTALFRASDNLESLYAKSALRQFYIALWRGNIAGWSLADFEEATGLKLVYEGNLKEDLPPMPQFLNRLLALPIDEQNQLFGALETRIEANIEIAVEAGTFERGVETIAADSLSVASRETVFTHEGSGAETEIVEIARKDRLEPLAADAAIELHTATSSKPPLLIVNAQSKRAAMVMDAPSRTLDDGDVQERVRLVRPAVRETMARAALEASQWRADDEDRWRALWDAEIAGLPSHRESRFWLVAGLLLPIWDRLPDESMRVRRLVTDPGTGPGQAQGEHLIGRVLGPAEVSEFRAALGLDGGPGLTAAEVHDEIMVRGASFPLANGWKLARRRLMGADRIEIEGPTDSDTDALKRMGCIAEIVSWRTRLFAPDRATLERSVPSTEKCSSDKSRRTRAPRSTA